MAQRREKPTDMTRPRKRRRLSARETAFRVASTLRDCRVENVVPMDVDDARFETSHRAILIDPSTTRQGKSWCFDVDLDAAIRTALATRKLAETLNALANCEAYDPEEAPRFWREELLHVVTRETLATYRLHCAFDRPFADAERLACVLATAISPFPDSQAMEIRHKAIALLGAFLVYRHAPQDVSMEICTSVDGRTSPVCWSLVRSTMFYLSRRWTSRLKVLAACPSSSSHHAIKLIANTGVGFAIDGKGLTDLEEIASMDHVSITELDCRIDVVDDANVSAFRRLMRALARVDTLRAITLQFRFYDDHFAGAVCSALLKMRSLRSCCLRFQGFQSKAVADLSTITDPGSYYSWLCYAMTATHGRQLALEFDVTPGADAKLLESKHGSHMLHSCLASQRQGKFEVKPNGTTAKLAVGASLSTATSPAVSSDADVSFLVESDSELDGWVEVVALVETKATVIVPGIGLMWIDVSSLSEWQTNSAGTNSVPRVTTQQLSFQARHVADTVDVVKCIGSSLTSFCFRNCSSVTNELLSGILAVCPRLEKIGFLGTGVLYFRPLHDAYRSPLGCAVKSIVYHALRYAGLNEQLVDAISYGLQELSVEAPLAVHDQRDLLETLEANRTLRYLRCRTLDDSMDEVDDSEDELDSTAQAIISLELKALGRLRDAPLRPSERSKTTSYAFLWASRHHQELRALPLPCVRFIVEFAVTPALRHMSYHEN